RGTGAHLVVLTHGLGSDLEYWTPHLDALAAHHRVLRWDLRGAGGSGKPPGPYDVALFARDLAALLDHLGEPAPHLVGHSRGADALTRPGGSVILSRGIRPSRLLMVPGAGHNLPIEMPALFITAVLAFLAGFDL